MDALKYVLTPDYASSNVGLVTAYIAGADDYYNYYVYLNNANTGVVDDDGTTYTADASGLVTVTARTAPPAPTSRWTSTPWASRPWMTTP